jgi:BTB/POZ domain.
MPLIGSFSSRYLYTDTLNIPDLDTAQGILYAAQKYLIPHLAKHCVKYLECSLNLDNLLDTLRIAECFKESHLRKQCLKVN